MAEAKCKLEETGCSCSICLEQFKKPRIIPCSHSFCHDCLVTYIRRVASNGKFNCPLCRQPTDLKTKVDLDSENFVECFPINKQLSPDVTLADLGGNTCTSCRQEIAEPMLIYYCYQCNDKLCEGCVIYHSRNRFLASHRLCKLDGVSENIEEFGYLNKIIKCKEHEWEEVKYMCKDHDEFCCNECAIVKHRKCDKLLSACKDIKTSDIKKITEALYILEFNTVALKTHESKQRETVMESEKMVKQHLKEFKQNIDTAFYKFKQTVLRDTRQMQEKLIAPIDGQLSDLQKVETSLKDLKKKLELVKSFGQHIHKIVIGREFSNDTKELDKRLKTLFDNASRETITSSGLNDRVEKALECFDADNVLSTYKNKIPIQRSLPPDQVADKKNDGFY